MKKALLGLSNNIGQHKEKIKIWADSFRKFSDGEVILLAANSNEEDIKVCNELNIRPIPVTVEDTWYINHKRLEHTYNFLKDTDIDLFMITDVFDVVFQSDPFQKFDLENYDLFMGAEGILMSEEPWNTDVVNKVFPGEIDVCKHHEIICSGVIGGKKDQLVSLYKHMYDKCESGTNNHNIKDQAALIIMIAKNEIDRLKIFNLNDAWAMHCSTSGPTQFFESWGLRNTIERRYNVPKMVDGKIYTNDNKLYDIVHQFNRVPEWKDILTDEFK
jgi:hypothetical protein